MKSWTMIKVGPGRMTVDTEDAARLAGVSFVPVRKGGRVYAKGCIEGKKRETYVHRFLMGCSAGDGAVIDHADGDGLNNRKSNLRRCTPKQNSQNQRKQNRPTSSRFKGVCWDKNRRKWHSGVRTEGRKINLGRFDTEESAAMAHDRKALELFGEFACLNFPSERRAR